MSMLPGKFWKWFERAEALRSFIFSIVGGGGVTTLAKFFDFYWYQALFVGFNSALVIFGFIYIYRRWNIDLPGGSERSPSIRFAGRKKVDAGGLPLEEDWHGKKLRVVLRSIKREKVETGSSGYSDEHGNYTKEYALYKDKIFAELDVSWGDATIHEFGYIKRTADGTFLILESDEGHEDQCSLGCFWNTKSGFWFLSVWVSHISEQQQFAVVDYAIVVAENLTPIPQEVTS